MWGFPKKGVPFWGRPNNDCSTLESTLGYLHFRKSPCTTGGCQKLAVFSGSSLSQGA